MKDLYCEITDNGYHIYDRNDELFHIHQYEPYIPNKSISYEENAQAQIHDIMVNDYIHLVINDDITLDDVPEEYYEEVKAAVKTDI